MALQTLPPESDSLALRGKVWLMRSWIGRLLILGAALKIAAWASGLAGVSSGLFSFLDTVGGLALLIVAIVLGYRAYLVARHRLLWRVRRKLILSYIFIGVVPVLLVLIFFTLGGLLFFFNVSAFMLRNHVASLVDTTRFLAQAAAPSLGGAAADQLMNELTTRQGAAASGYGAVSYALVPSDRCRTGSTAPVLAAGPWAHLDPPREIPSWVPCSGFAGLMAYSSEGGTAVTARAVAWPPGLGSALVVDIPFDAALRQQFRSEMGITIEEYARVGIDGGDQPATSMSNGRPRGLLVGTLNVPSTDRQEPFGWVAFLEYTDWVTGSVQQLTVGFRMGPAAVYQYLSGPSLQRMQNFNLGQILLFLLAVVGGLFLIIQAVALVMGLTLARSITGSVHALFTGTERVQRGDFAHKIAIRSRDQLGELAASFNSMTASIEGLLREKAEKERLEQELRIARSIQMSLLPQGPLHVPGVSLAGHCEPAREVGGDYYDFLPLDDHRLGILIADVAGKGTSAALYMAELKGLVLSLSRQHRSPRQLLIDANQIISKHLDARSFITMTYAVVDLHGRTLTWARAGHCPLVFVPGPHASSRVPQVLAPDGMVLGLQFDMGDTFARLLEEVTIPIGGGDLFLLYTDGISEAMNTDGEYFGDGRLVDLAERHSDLPSDALQAHILDEVHGFAGEAQQHDDMTMVLIKIDDV